MGEEGILGEAECHIRRPMPSITAGASRTPRHGGWWGQQATGHMPAALGRRGLISPERHTSHRAKSRANTKPNKRQSTKTRTEKSTKVYQVDQDSTEAADRELNYEVDQMVTEADFER
jgi:hypothetical protein